MGKYRLLNRGSRPPGADKSMLARRLATILPVLLIRAMKT
jgi:predicted ATPase with chaperone activity